MDFRHAVARVGVSEYSKERPASNMHLLLSWRTASPIYSPEIIDQIVSAEIQMIQN